MSLKKRLPAGLAIVAVCVIAGLLLTRRNHSTLTYQGKSVEEWSVQLYVSQDQGARDAASAALKTLGPKAIPDIIRMLRNKDPFIRRQVWSLAPQVPLRFRKGILANVKPPRAGLYHIAAMRAVGAIGADARPAIPDLARKLQAKDLQECWEAGTALGCIGPEAVRVLLAALQSELPAVRQAALLGLKEIGPEAAQAVSAVIEKLGDRDEWVRGWAAQTLISIGRPAIPQLLQIVENSTGEVRRGAAFALAGIYPSRRVASPPLLKMMNDPEPALREQAIETLTAIHASDEAVIRAMKNALQDSDANVRQAATRALVQLGKDYR
jgi:HEAT repeat protein